MEALYKYLNQITPITDKTWALLKGFFVQKELKKGDYFCVADKVATKNLPYIAKYKLKP